MTPQRHRPRDEQLMTLRDNETVKVGVGIAPAPALAVAPAAAPCAQRKASFVVDETMNSNENKEQKVMKNDSNEGGVK